MFELDLIARRLVELFPDDPSAPGILVSFIADKEHFYASAQRFAETFGRGRTVIAKATGTTSEEALRKVCETLGIYFGVPDGSERD